MGYLKFILSIIFLHLFTVPGFNQELERVKIWPETKLRVISYESPLTQIYRYIPIHGGIEGYDMQGLPIKIETSDTLLLRVIYQGTLNDRSGKWGEFGIVDFNKPGDILYLINKKVVFLDDMKTIDSRKEIREMRKKMGLRDIDFNFIEEMEESRRSYEYKKFTGTLLLALAIITLFVMLWGIRTNCPKCQKWWVRYIIGEEVINIFSINQSKGVYNYRQEYVGSVDIPVPYKTCILTYKCKKCRHEWNKRVTMRLGETAN